MKKAAAVEKRGVELEDDDMRRVLATEEGRRMLFKILAHCRVFETITVQNSLIYTLSGARDVGLFVMAQITRADELAFLRMMQENMARERQNRADEADSAQDVADE
ncbi:MAG TPA: hypothetical protein VNA66_10170 [Gammaproteobacteria bacterium]|nr:hypothetical protein [Gammaproteobacteria bacterium]